MEDLDLTSFGLMDTTLEEVFLKVSEEDQSLENSDAGMDGVVGFLTHGPFPGVKPLFALSGFMGFQTGVFPGLPRAAARTLPLSLCSRSSRRVTEYRRGDRVCLGT